MVHYYLVGGEDVVSCDLFLCCLCEKRRAPSRLGHGPFPLGTRVSERLSECDQGFFPRATVVACLPFSLLLLLVFDTVIIITFLCHIFFNGGV
jgi:hypothetical protein